MEKCKQMMEKFLKYRYFLQEIVSRDIKLRYRRSFLGLLWTVLNPLLMMMVMTVIFSNLFKVKITNFPVYMLTGSILFGFHSETTNQSLFSIINNASLIKKVYVPKYLFPLSRALSCAVNLGFSFIALLIVMIVTGASFHPTLGLIWIPILFLMLFSSGLSLILSAYTVFFRDLGQIYGVVIMAWTYFTPIFYPIDIVPKSYQWLMQLNPMYHYINYFRMLVLEGTIPSLEQTMICLLMGIISFLLGLFIFYKKQDKFILYI